MRTRWSVIALVVSLLVGAASQRARAQSASVQAQSLFDEGRKLLADGKLGQACAAFESSQKLDPAVTTLLNLADCREQNHQLATAWGAFVEANRMAKASNNAKLSRVATNHAQKLEPRLSKLAIMVPAENQVPGLEVLRDQEPVNAAAWNHTLPIDGGTYTISARAPGRAPWSTTRTIKLESDAVTITVPLLGEATSVASSGGAPGAKPAKPRVAGPSGGALGVEAGGARSRDPVPAAPVRSSHVRVMPLLIGGGSVVLGGVAIGFLVSGNRLYDRAKAAGPGPGEALRRSANTRRYLAEGFGVAALGCAGAAVYLYVSGRDDARSDATAIAPLASPQLTGLAVVGTW